jgi:hypothetical protein
LSGESDQLSIWPYFMPLCRTGYRRGVLPAVKDDAGCIFLDRDPRHFQLVLNYLRDGWCQLPKSLEERRELLQEVRYYQVRLLLLFENPYGGCQMQLLLEVRHYQLRVPCGIELWRQCNCCTVLQLAGMDSTRRGCSHITAWPFLVAVLQPLYCNRCTACGTALQLAGMEAWVRTQDVLGEAALCPQSPDPYSSHNTPLNLNLMPLVGSPGTPQHASSLSAPGGTATTTGSYAQHSTTSVIGSPANDHEAAYFGPGSLSMRNSFLHGANQDLLAAGTAAAACIRFSSISPVPGHAAGYGSRSSVISSPEPNSVFGAYGAGMTSSLASRPSSASPYVGAMGGNSSSSSPVGDVAAGYAAGFAAAQQNVLAARRSVVSERRIYGIWQQSGRAAAGMKTCRLMI